VAQVIEENGELILKLSRLEKIYSLHQNIRVKTSDLVSITEYEKPWNNKVLRGFRAPGTGLPFVILFGTMRFRGGKDFVAIYKRGPVKVYEFKAGEFKRWILSI
jgi:hypothetical protein